MRKLCVATACLWIALTNFQALAQQAELPPNALAIENGLPWIVGRSAVPDARLLE